LHSFSIHFSLYYKLMCLPSFFLAYKLFCFVTDAVAVPTAVVVLCAYVPIFVNTKSIIINYTI